MKLITITNDSLISFPFTTIRFTSYVDLSISLIGFVYAIVMIINKIFFGIDSTGWTSIMMVMLFLGDIQLITLGILGEYIWRGVDEARKRPLYLISEKN
jgi:dolichol-phosphate mannosyltransferase